MKKTEYHPHPQPIVRATRTIGPNEPCVCGSGKKKKKCHMYADTAAELPIGVTPIDRYAKVPPGAAK